MKRISRKSVKNRAIVDVDRHPSLSPESETINLWHDPFVHLILIIVAGFLVYMNTVAAPFIFDDYLYLVNNPAIRDFGYFAGTDKVLGLGIDIDIKYNFILRPVSYLTFALNYALHGLDVRGYHVANLLIHIANALLVYLMISLLFKSPAITAPEDGERLPAASIVRYMPLFCALLFVSHPLQTQAVTYIIQRFTPLVALLYLGSLVLYLQGRLGATAPMRNTCYLLSFVVVIMAMKTKENAFTLPVMIAMLETLFFTGSIGSRIARLAPFLLTMAIIPISLMELSSLTNPEVTDAINDSINLVNYRDVSSWNYLMTQFGVITTYLRLLILPVGQNFDYYYQLQKSFFSFQVLAPLGVLSLILAGAVYAYYRSRDCSLQERYLYRIAAFGIFWFFITLSVESSIIPLDDLIFEHRVYLPSVGFFMAMLAVVAIVFRYRTASSLFESRVALCTLVIVVVCLSAAAIARNRVWGDAVTFWSDVAQKSPQKARVHVSLGIALADSGGQDEAIKEFRTAIRLNPKGFMSYVNLGKVLTAQKKFDEAERELLTVAGLYPKSPIPHVDLGLVYEGKGDRTKARWSYLEAIKINPAFPEAYSRLGELYEKGGEIEDAIRAFEASLQLYPDQVVAKRVVDLRRMLGNS